jgi:hypothetical protein
MRANACTALRSIAGDQMMLTTSTEAALGAIERRRGAWRIAQINP